MESLHMDWAKDNVEIDCPTIDGRYEICISQFFCVFLQRKIMSKMKRTLFSICILSLLGGGMYSSAHACGGISRGNHRRGLHF